MLFRDKIKYIKGNAIKPEETGGTRFIVHCCNDVGGWGGKNSFVNALSAAFGGKNEVGSPEHCYRTWYRKEHTFRFHGNEESGVIPFKLGEVQFVPVGNETWVVNMIGQHDVRWQGSKPPVRYDAIELGLQYTQRFAEAYRATVHCPRFGAGLAGGSWDEIEKIIDKQLTMAGTPVTVYDYVP